MQLCAYSFLDQLSSPPRTSCDSSTPCSEPLPSSLAVAGSRYGGAHAEPDGSSCEINRRIISGLSSPAGFVRLYDRSKPFGPSTLISQFSLARDPMIDTRQSPRRSANACSMRAAISRHRPASPRFCKSMVTPIPAFYRPEYCPSVVQRGQTDA